MTSIALGVENLTQHHTGYNICQDLQNMFEGWNIDPKRIVSVTTDNGANIISGLKKLMQGHTESGLDVHVSCFAHNINLVVSKSLGCKEVEVIVQIIEKVKQIVAYFIVMLPKTTFEMNNKRKEKKMVHICTLFRR